MKCILEQKAMKIGILAKSMCVQNVVKLKRLNYDCFYYRVYGRLLNWPYGQKI